MERPVIAAAKVAGKVISSDADSDSLRRTVSGQLKPLHDATLNTQSGRWGAIKILTTRATVVRTK